MRRSGEPPKPIVIREVRVVGIILGPWQPVRAPADAELGFTTPENPEEAW